MVTSNTTIPGKYVALRCDLGGNMWLLSFVDKVLKMFKIIISPPKLLA